MVDASRVIPCAVSGTANVTPFLFSGFPHKGPAIRRASSTRSGGMPRTLAPDSQGPSPRDAMSLSM